MRKKLLLALMAGLLLVGLGEGICRLAERSWQASVLSPSGDTVDLLALNYNDTTVSRRKPPAEWRVLGFGDSYCYSTVKTPATLHSVAAEILTRAGAGSGPAARFVNLGEPGTSFAQYRKAMDHWIGRIEADAVVVSLFLGNDSAEYSWRSVPDDLPVNGLLRETSVEIATNRKRPMVPPHAYGLRLADYVAAFADVWATGEYVLSNLPEPHTGLYGPLPPAQYLEMVRLHGVAGQPARCGELARGWQALADLGRELSRLGRERGLRVAVMLAPAEAAVNPGLWREAARQGGLDPQSFDPSLPGRMARAVLAQAAPEVAVLDLTPAFACAAARGDANYPPGEIHWNAAGNRLAGQALARFVGLTWLGLEPSALAGLDPCLEAEPLAAGAADAASCLAAAMKPGP